LYQKRVWVSKGVLDKGGNRFWIFYAFLKGISNCFTFLRKIRFFEIQGLIENFYYYTKTKEMPFFIGNRKKYTKKCMSNLNPVKNINACPDFVFIYQQCVSLVTSEHLPFFNHMTCLDIKQVWNTFFTKAERCAYRVYRTYTVCIQLWAYWLCKGYSLYNDCIQFRSSQIAP
jgi:hypothetical protein